MITVEIPMKQFLLENLTIENFDLRSGIIWNFSGMQNAIFNSITIRTLHQDENNLNLFLLNGFISNPKSYITK